MISNIAIENLVDYIRNNFSVLREFLDYNRIEYKCKRLDIETYDKALELLYKHINNFSCIKIFGDVDVDGIASMYIVYKSLQDIGVWDISVDINSRKVHGLTEPVNNPGGLTIILDSSSNLLDIIKNSSGDIIILDHHVIFHNVLTGNTKDGEYIIVNSVLSGEEISTGVLAYEFFRDYYSKFDNIKSFEQMLLHQWAGISIFSDSINMLNERCQYYVVRMFNDNVIEPKLKELLKIVNNCNVNRIDKNMIVYKLIPFINATIRAEESKSLVESMLFSNRDYEKYKVYLEIQNNIVNSKLENFKYNNEKIILFEIEQDFYAYTGLIAAKLASNYNAPSFVYCKEGDLYKGSFRGLDYRVDYRITLEKLGMKAEGHKMAFGLVVDEEGLNCLKNWSYDWEIINDNNLVRKVVITEEELISLWDKIIYIGKFNNYVNSTVSISFLVKNNDLKLIDIRGKIFVYMLYSFIEAIAFEPLITDILELYIQGFKIYLYNYYGG